METSGYLLLGIILVIAIVGLIINPAIAVAILFFLFIYCKVQKQKSENARLTDYYKSIREKRLDAYYDAVNKRVNRKNH